MYHIAHCNIFQDKWLCIKRKQFHSRMVAPNTVVIEEVGP